MSGPRRALYNPGLLRREELVKSFCAREREFAALLADLRKGGKQHHLIVGQRGAGKTTLLLRLGVAIEDDVELGGRALALRFPEEQYNLVRISDLWLNCLDALIDALEHRGEHELARHLDDLVAALDELAPQHEAERARRALELLLGEARAKGRLLVLLVDNLDLVLQRLAEAQWELRDVLSADNGLVVIGACATYPEELVAYQAAFYEFFHVTELGPLGPDEARTLLLALAEQAHTPHVAEVLEHHPGRFEALRVLSGGMPRTLALLHGLLAQETSSTAEDDLELLLDQVTPYYKARFEELPSQSQVVFDAVALAWRPVTAAECAVRARMEINPASAQLARLVKQGVLEKSHGAEHSRLTFLVRERFFNLWYLMRASRRLRRRLLWLTAFLETFYGQAEVERRARELLAAQGTEATKDPAKLFAFAAAVAEPALRRTLELHAVEEVVRMAARGAPPAELDLAGEDRHLAPDIERMHAAYDLRARLAQLAQPSGQRAADGGAPWLAQDPLTSLATKHLMVGSSLGESLTWIAQRDRHFFSARLLDAVGRGLVPPLPDLRTLEDLDQLLALSDSEPQRSAVWAFAALRSALDPAALLERGRGEPWFHRAQIWGGLLYAHLASNWPLVRSLLQQALTSGWFGPELARGLWRWHELVAAGRSSETAELLLSAGLAERNQPLYEALRAAAQAGDDDLAHLAPEVRAPTQAILTTWREALGLPRSRGAGSDAEMPAYLSEGTARHSPPASEQQPRQQPQSRLRYRVPRPRKESSETVAGTAEGKPKARASRLPKWPRR